MTDLTAGFETGVSGNLVSSGDAGDATAWDATFADAPTYDNTHAAHGTLSAKVTTTVGAIEWSTAFGTRTNHYGRIYLYLTANPGGGQEPAPMAHVISGAAGADLRLYISSAGKMLLYREFTLLATGTVSLSLNQWVRIEWHILNSTTVGVFESKLFNTADGTSADETLTASSIDTGTGTTQAWFGNWAGDGLSSNYWIDDILAGATSYPGPYTSGATYTILNASESQLTNVNAGGTDVDPLSYKDGVSLTTAELVALAATPNVYVMKDLLGGMNARQLKRAVAISSQYQST